MRISIDNCSPFVTEEDTSEALAKTLSNKGHDVKLHLGDQPFYARMKSFPCDYYFTDITVISRDMIHYCHNVKPDTLFIINIPYTATTQNILAAEDVLISENVKYKFVSDPNFGKEGILLKRPNSNINFTYGHTGCLLDTENIKWNNNKINTLLIINGNMCDIQALYSFARKGVTFHTLNTMAKGRNSEDPKYLTMNKSITEYKNILCNYDSFCFWRLDLAPLGRVFYELCRLRKPIYVYDPVKITHIHKTLKQEVDISYSNKENIDFETLYDYVEENLTFEKQVDKLLSHLPKPKVKK